MLSTKDSRQPYKLSNLLLVTESLTFIAGKGKAFAFVIDKVLPSVVVSSVTPIILL